VEKTALKKFDDMPEESAGSEGDLEMAQAELRRRVRGIDLKAAAERLGAEYLNGLLVLKVLGKNVGVNSDGDLFTDVHMHPWVAIPILNYLASSAGVDVSGKWVPLRELRNGKTWFGLFTQRCEKPLKRVADMYPDLFEDMLHVFSGKQVENHYDSDISLVLRPLPKFPILICYWKPEDNMESSIHLFFDSTAEENLPIESIYGLATGLVRMFEKIALRHGAGSIF